jgi:hypothetical protein
MKYWASFLFWFSICVSSFAQDASVAGGSEVANMRRSGPSGLASSILKEKVFFEKGIARVGADFSLNRVTNPYAGNGLFLRRNYQVDLPFYAGLRVLPGCSLEAGCFVGMLLNKPTSSNWFDSEAGGLSAWRYAPSLGLMMGMGVEIPALGKIKLRYFQYNSSMDSPWGNLSLGWKWEW